MFKDKIIFISGGSGFLGQALTQKLLKHDPKKIIIFSRSEYKQHLMKQEFNHPALRFLIGDIRDYDRLLTALKNVDYVIHAAALKRIDQMEYCPDECIKTNVIGSMNIINAAIRNNVKKVIAISTDKSCNPINVYGSTKLTMEKLVTNGNALSGNNTIFACVRYGNVEGSTGSVIPYFKKLIAEKKRILPITDERMTRFHITMDQAIDLIFIAFEESKGGEIFIPKIPSYRITDLVKSLQCAFEVTGIRPGEKLHEIMITNEDASRTYDCGDYYIIQPDFDWIEGRIFKGEKVSYDFEYSSNNNKEWIFQ